MALPSGEFAVLSLNGQRLYTHQGTIATPPAIRGPLYVWITKVGGFKAIGQGWSQNVTIEWIANQGQWVTNLPVSSGMYGAIYDLTGTRHINDGSWGAAGIRYIDPTQNLPAGRLVTGDETHFDASQLLNDFTDLGDGLRIGQDNATDAPVIWDAAIQAKRLLINPDDPAAPPDNARFIHAIREGEDVAIQYHQPLGKPAVIVYATMSELRALPVYAPAWPPFNRQVGVGYFKVTTGVGAFDAPGHFEILTNGVLWSSVRDKSRPVIADLQSAASVPVGSLIAIFADVYQAQNPRPMADRLGIPVIWYSDEFPYPQANLPSSALASDFWMLKCYPTATPVEINRELTRLTAIHPKLAVAWPSYVQTPPTWSLAEVIAHQRPLYDTVRQHPAVTLIGCFSGPGRIGGIGTYPQLAQYVDQLLTASDGLPDIAVKVPPPPPPPPIPAPVPPVPPIYPLATEVSMNPAIVGLIGPGGFYARVDPLNPSRIYFDRTSVGEHGRVEVTKPDTKHTLRFTAANVIVNGAPKWECGTDLNRQFETRPPNQRWGDESWSIVQLPDGRILAYIQHEVDGRLFTSAPLTLVRQ